MTGLPRPGSSACLFLLLPVLGLAPAARSAGLPTQTYPAGELLSTWKEGGRLATWHNGYFYAWGMAHSQVYDISDPKNPAKVATGLGSNGHRWAKFRNAFWKEYQNVDSPTNGFLDLAALPEFKPHPGGTGIPAKGSQDLFTYPHRESGGKLVDMRTGQTVGAVAPASLKTVTGSNKLRIGNLWFYTPGDDQAGVTAIDVGNPANPKLLCELKGDYKQYTTAYQVWRHYLLLLIGDNTNVGGKNLIAIDFQDPADLKVAWGLTSAESAGGRYIMFQDEFGFLGRANGGIKLNLETRQVVQRFKTVGYNSDFQWIPLGHLVMQTASEEPEGQSQSHIFSHQAELDKRPPTVGYHLPKAGAVNQPLGTVVGLVINETLEDSTIHDKTLVVRPVGGQPIAADVIAYSYNVINIAPREPLLPNTTYEVETVAGGIRDVAGNGITGHKFNFTTGPAVGGPGSIFGAGAESQGGGFRFLNTGGELLLRAGRFVNLLGRKVVPEGSPLLR
jgi:large repetitive protein